MSLPRLVSAAFFGIRPDRDTQGYYRDALKELVAAYPGEAIVLTNDLGQFPELAVEAFFVDDYGKYAREVWPSPDLERYRQNASKSRGGRKNAQSSKPELSLVWLAKTVLAMDDAVMNGPVWWVDAGLRNSMYGVGRARYIEAGLVQEGERLVSGGQECFATIERKPRAARPWRHDFHGANRWEMERLARRFGVTQTDEQHVVGGMMFLTRDVADTVLMEFGEVWQTMLDMGIAGTEETVLSVLRWKYGWSAQDLRDWSDRITEPV